MCLIQRWQIFEPAGTADEVDRLEINAAFAAAAPVAKPTAGVIFSSLHNEFDATSSVAILLREWPVTIRFLCPC